MTTKRKAAKSAKSAGKKKAGAKKAGGAAKTAARGGLSVATSASRSVKERVAALSAPPLAATEKEDSLQAVLRVLANKDEPAQVRLAALQTLQAASFGSPAYESVRGDYIGALREVAEDPHAELRQRALGILAREKDSFVQDKLLEGLQNPEKALVPPEKALQLLSYDVHAEAYPVARAIVSEPPNPAAKREALRLLAADASSAPMFERILRDKDEPAEVRQLSASALHALRPEKLQEHAREILLDASEQGEIQATSLTALTQFGDDEAVSSDETLLNRVNRLSEEAPAKVKQSARRFLGKYGR
jgi:hypothetical protein